MEKKGMRILFLGNNWLGWKVIAWLKEQGEEIVGLVIHQPAERKFGEEILRAAGLPEDKIFLGSRLRNREGMDAIRSLHPDLGISILFDYILKPEFLRLFPSGVINLHPAFLPYNRGQYPNVWSIVEGTPAGATLHYIDAHIDTGDIIARKEVAVEPVDTGESLYRKLERASLNLFQETWPLLKAGKAERIPQTLGSGTFHYTRDTEKIDRLDPERTYRARDLINILRARTFPPYRGAYIEAGGKRVYLRLQLEDGEEETGRAENPPASRAGINELLPTPPEADRP
jgi:methionyl-tRNA formyltransferase